MKGVTIYPFWLTKRELKVLLKATVQITSAVCFNPECTVPRGPAQEGSNSSPSPSEQLKCTRSSIVATGQRLGVCHRSSNRQCQCTQDCSPSYQPVMGPHSPPWNIKKSRGPHTSDTSRSCLELGYLHCTTVGAKRFSYKFLVSLPHQIQGFIS